VSWECAKALYFWKLHTAIAEDFGPAGQ
jgi:hypothetical protein